MPNRLVSASRSAGLVSDVWNRGFAASDEDGVDVEAVLVDQVVLPEGRHELGAAERHVAAGLGLEGPDLVRDALVMSRQMRAKSATGPVLEGSESAVGQNPAMS